MSKRIRDPIHRFVHVEEQDIRLIDHRLVQRLRWVSQLPLEQLVYPSAQHSRFEHSLGTMHLADQAAKAKDDVRLARQWLKDRSRCDDAAEVRQYEQEFAAWNGSEYAFAFMGGRVALSACIHALKLKAGDEVIIPGYTCVVVPNSFAYAGVKVVYSDIELETYGLEASLLSNKITSKTKAIMLHHLYGLVCRDYEQILQIAKENGLWIIEDCAHATGAEYKGRKVGNYGHVAFYSSEQSKVFTTIQGGMAVTNDQQLAAGLQEYSDRR